MNKRDKKIFAHLDLRTHPKLLIKDNLISQIQRNPWRKGDRRMTMRIELRAKLLLGMKIKAKIFDD